MLCERVVVLRALLHGLAIYALLFSHVTPETF